MIQVNLEFFRLSGKRLVMVSALAAIYLGSATSNPQQSTLSERLGTRALGRLHPEPILTIVRKHHDIDVRDRRASQGPQGRVAPSGGARQGPIPGYVLQSVAPAGPSP